MRKFAKRYLTTIFWILVSAFLLFEIGYSFTNSWDEDAPAGSDNPRSGDDEIRDFKFAIRERLAVDHYFLASEAADAKIGYHKNVRLIEAADIGTGASGIPILGAQTVSGKPELVYTDEDDNDIVLTNGGAINQGAGAVVQIVYTQDAALDSTATTIPCDNTTPQITEGKEIMTRAITPTSASNDLLIEVVAHVSGPTGGEAVIAVFNTDLHATNAVATSWKKLSATGAGAVLTLMYKVSAPGTASTTFRVRMGVHSGTAYFNGDSGGAEMNGTLGSSIKITEIRV